MQRLYRYGMQRLYRYGMQRLYRYGMQRLYRYGMQRLYMRAPPSSTTGGSVKINIPCIWLGMTTNAPNFTNGE
jgi:hypothetical protein